MRKYFTLAMIALLVGAITPATALAGQEKVAVCHSEGTGEFHQITIADPAFETHVGHGDGIPGGEVPGMPGHVFDENCGVMEVALVSVAGAFIDPVGSTVADERGLTYTYAGQTFTDPGLVYANEYWGTYPLYLPGGVVDIQVTVSNAGATTTDPLTLAVTAYELNLDGSLNSSILYPPHTVGLTVGPESETQVPVEFVLPYSAKGLDVVYLSVFLGDPSEGLLLGEESVVFCPPAVD